jgi:hypothetical protein
MKGSSHVVIWRYDAAVFLVRLGKTTISFGMVDVKLKTMKVMTSEASPFEATSILFALDMPPNTRGRRQPSTLHSYHVLNF